MHVKVQSPFMLMEVSMFAGDMGMRRREFFAEPLRDAGEVQHAEKNQHQAYGEFHGEADARRNDEAEENDAGADHGDRKSVAAAPKNADEAGFRDGAFVADDGRDGDDVIGISGVTHPKEKTNRKNGEAASQS